MKIAVVGTGYVGLVTGTCFAETGNDVVCVDINEEKVRRMQAGEVPIYEPYLDTVFHRNIRQKRLSFSTNLKESIHQAKIIFLALPTPPGEDGSADLSYVLGVAEQLGGLLEEYTVIVDKSTVPVGTSELVHKAIAKHAKVEFDVVSNPEFLREGFAVEDFMKPDRVVIGTSSAKAAAIMEDLYKPFVRQGNPLIVMDEKSAELTKYAANAFLATKITFMNEIANFCELVGADVDKVRAGIGTDTRIGKRFLFPGIGYGGSCFPKDVQALARSGEQYGYHFEILNSVLKVNDRQKVTLVGKLKRFYNNQLSGKKFAVWGLAFKPDTDDIREAPALFMIDALLDSGASVCAFDPEAMENVKAIYRSRITFAEDMYTALIGTDALLIATEWSVFRNPDFERIGSLLNQRVIFDGRNLFETERLQQYGFYYESIGRETVKP
jgi:UDPglucose 6-dehydrogenase